MYSMKGIPGFTILVSDNLPNDHQIFVFGRFDFINPKFTLSKALLLASTLLVQIKRFYRA